MIELNKTYCIDVMDGLRMLEDNSIDVIITSPPYNKFGLNKHSNPTQKWHGSIDYNGDVNVDNMPEDDYQKWQLDFLNECFRVLKPNGSMFYNHKNRIVIGKGEIITPYQWILKSNFKVRQEIVWDSRNSPDINTCRYQPSTERIYWLTKSNRPVFKRNAETMFKNEVWRINAEKKAAHPAPFPVEIPDNILQCMPEGIIVLDPFMGSGTTAISALKHGDSYIGFELFQEYVDMTNERIRNTLPQG